MTTPVNNKGRDSIGGKKGTHRDYTGEITIDLYCRKPSMHMGTVNLWLIRHPCASSWML